jgi:hypothetical protein
VSFLLLLASARAEPTGVLGTLGPEPVGFSVVASTPGGPVGTTDHIRADEALLTVAHGMAGALERCQSRAGFGEPADVRVTLAADGVRAIVPWVDGAPVAPSSHDLELAHGDTTVAARIAAARMPKPKVSDAAQCVAEVLTPMPAVALATLPFEFRLRVVLNP